ncbi:MAG: hypothetical protein WKF81_01055 [Thermomicrobiales bacterium]
MRFLDKIKKGFDTGGVALDLSAPKQFRWSDETLALSLTLAGHDTEVRTISSIKFRLREATRSSENKSARDREREGIRYTRSEPLVLQPGESATIDIQFPLTISEIFEQAGALENAPGWLKTAVNVVDTGSKLSMSSSDYTISATPEIEGANMSKGVSRRIEQVGVGDFHFGL